MSGFAVNSLRQQAFLLPASRASQKGSLFAAMVLGLSFNASMASVMGSTLGMFSTSVGHAIAAGACLLYTSPSPRDQRGSRMPSSA